MTEQMEGQATWSDPDTWYGKMFPEHCLAPEKDTQEKTSKQSSPKSSKSSTQNAPMFLYLRRGNGPSQDASWVSERTDLRFPLPTEFTTRSFGESPRDENASVLSQTLVESVPEKYCLSEKACAGILRRAESRGKQLPPILKEALENQIRDN